jgi:hypothetical protein
MRIVLVLLLTLTGAFAADSAFARGPRVFVGVGFGAPFPYYYPYGYYPPYPYYYPSPIVVQQQPTVYVEQPAAPQAQPQQPAGYWYYCNDSRAYYPYVKDCASPWQRVAPQPG